MGSVAHILISMYEIHEEQNLSNQHFWLSQWGEAGMLDVPPLGQSHNTWASPTQHTAVLGSMLFICHSRLPRGTIPTSMYNYQSLEHHSVTYKYKVSFATY